MKLEFLKDRYDYELQRKEQLTGALSLPVGVLGGLGSLIALMARSFPGRHGVFAWFFWPLLTADVGAFTLSLLYLGGAYHRQTYKYLPLLSELEDWELENREWLDYVGRTGAMTDEPAVSSFLRTRIIEAADFNTANNDERSRLLFWARTWLFVILWLTMFAGLFYVADFKRL